MGDRGSAPAMTLLKKGISPEILLLPKPHIQRAAGIDVKAGYIS